MLRATSLFIAMLAVAIPAAAKPPTIDHSRSVRATAAGGFVMGSPTAKVKLIEYGSLTCSHCRAFDLEAADLLIANYVRRGRVSWEFRSFLLNGYDIPATLAAACSGPANFFPAIRSLYAAQPEWIASMQAIPADRLDAIRAMPPSRQYRAIGEAAGFPALAATWRVPAAKITTCLADDAQAERFVKATSDGASRFGVTGTPTFFVNGVKLDTSAGPTPWSVVRARIDAALKNQKLGPQTPTRK